MSSLLAPLRWTPEELEAERQTALRIFCTERMAEPLDDYLEIFDDVVGDVETLLEQTVDLAEVDHQAAEWLREPRLLRAFRYLAGPPISEDDLKALVGTSSLSTKQLAGNPELVRLLIDTVLTGLDRRRFPWVADDRSPTEAERQAAITASAALMAAQGAATLRRSEGKTQQEAAVKDALLAAGFAPITIPGNSIPTLDVAPQRGQFCGEVQLGTRKADLVVRLWDGRLLAIECKVSNSFTNSIKRLNNDAAVKAETWREEFGSRQIVPLAVLSGLYQLHHLENAQQRGLSLCWAHWLDDLIGWIAQTRA